MASQINDEQPDNHAHDHVHDHDHSDEHDHDRSFWGKVRELLPFGHNHSHAEMNIDTALESSAQGIWALKVSLLGLGATALIQLLVVILSGSVGLLADTIHNFSDALTAVPLWIAFSLAQRPPDRRYTYGYGRAEDMAGLFIVLMIFLSVVVAAYESVQKLINPQPVTNLPWVATAALVGFLGNEAVAEFRIRVGSRIGSAALLADGLHARADGFTSLAVLLGVIGVALGFPSADPLVGILITITILFVLKSAAATIWHRLMDAVDHGLVDTIEQVAAGIPGVQSVHNVQVRWIGHKLSASLHTVVPAGLTVGDSHDLAQEVRLALFHRLPRLAEIVVHADPDDHLAVELNNLTARHKGSLAGETSASEPEQTNPALPLGAGRGETKADTSM